jgi:hypothetical protein
MNGPRTAGRPRLDPNSGVSALILIQILFPLALTLAAAGCGGEPRRESASGAVTLDGKPLDDGNIRFTPDAGDGLAVGSLVRDGRYSLPNPPGLAPGGYRVSITADGGSAAVAGVAPDSDLGRPGGAKGRIPARYNERTILRAEVTAGGANAFDYKLLGTPDPDPARARTAGR